MTRSKTSPPTERARIRRLPMRAAYDRETIDAILDAGFVGHVAFVSDGSPMCVPMIYGRVGDRVILHGSTASRALRVLSEGAEFSFSVTHLDGLVLARSAFHHSANFRSVVLLGRAEAISDPDQKRAVLEALVERVLPGRMTDARGPSAKELTATAVVALSLDEAAAKIRVGGPVDDEEDLRLPVWAGVVPLAVRASAPIPAHDLIHGIERPDYVDRWMAALHTDGHVSPNPPAGYPRISPYLNYEDTETMVEWLARAFAMLERHSLRGPDGKVSHAEMALEDGVVMMGSPGGDFRNPKHLGQVTQSLYVYVDDLDAHCARARAAGAEIFEEPTDTPYGDRRYGARDPEGHHWYFASRNQ